MPEGFREERQLFGGIEASKIDKNSYLNRLPKPGGLLRGQLFLGINKALTTRLSFLDKLAQKLKLKMPVRFLALFLMSVVLAACGQKRPMKLTTLLFFSILTIFTSCNGQTKNNASDATQLSGQIAKGDTVDNLGNHLWYVFQDKKSNYWFGSNGEGVYRYDGKTLVRFTTKDGLCNDSIRQIKEDGFGNVYFSTMGGINKFDGKQFPLCNL